MKKLAYLFTVVITMMLAPFAIAHPGHHQNDWMHSFYTLDHLLVMLVIGLSGIAAGSAIWFYGPKAYAMQRRIVGATLAVMSLMVIAYGIIA